MKKGKEITKETATTVDQVTELQVKDISKLINWQPKEDKPLQNRGAYEVIGQSVGRLVDEKQKAYGGIERVHAAMQVFYPEGIPGDKLSDALLIVRILDKVNRISGGDKTAFSESPWRDIAGYGLLGFSEETCDVNTL